MVPKSRDNTREKNCACRYSVDVILRLTVLVPIYPKSKWWFPEPYGCPCPRATGFDIQILDGIINVQKRERYVHLLKNSVISS